MKVNNVVKIPTSLDEKFFKNWFLFLRPFHKLSNKEMDIAASFAYERFKLSKNITDNALLDKVTMSEETYREIKSKNELSPAHFQVIMSKLRKNKVIIEGKLNPKFIPNISADSKDFKLLFLFDLNAE